MSTSSESKEIEVMPALGRKQTLEGLQAARLAYSPTDLSFNENNIRLLWIIRSNFISITASRKELFCEVF